MKKIVLIIPLIIFLNSCELDDINTPHISKPRLYYTDFMINNPDNEYDYSIIVEDAITYSNIYFGLSAYILPDDKAYSYINCGDILLGKMLLFRNDNNRYSLPEYFENDSLDIHKDSLRGHYHSIHIPSNSTYDLPEVGEDVYIVKPFKFTEKNPDTFSINEDFTIQWETDSIASDVIVVIDNYQLADLGDEIYDSESVSDSGEYTISQEILKKYSSTDRINITLIREKAVHDNISGFAFRFLSYSIESKLFFLRSD